MSRIKECFENLQADGQTALIPYVTAGTMGNGTIATCSG